MLYLPSFCFKWSSGEKKSTLLTYYYIRIILLMSNVVQSLFGKIINLFSKTLKSDVNFATKFYI